MQFLSTVAALPPSPASLILWGGSIQPSWRRANRRSGYSGRQVAQWRGERDEGAVIGRERWFFPEYYCFQWFFNVFAATRPSSLNVSPRLIVDIDGFSMVSPKFRWDGQQWSWLHENKPKSQNHKIFHFSSILIWPDSPKSVLKCIIYFWKVTRDDYTLSLYVAK